MFKVLSSLLLVAMCAGCAGTSSSSSGDTGGITMYGVIDQGISVRK